ncbi:MAG: hypothetical protein AAF961_14815 [Planctomycetota bacterium]
MATKLPDELRREIAANPGQVVSLVDEQTNRVYYVVGEEFLFDGVERDAESRKRLLSLLKDGEGSDEISKERAHDRMRRTIDKYKNQTA